MIGQDVAREVDAETREGEALVQARVPEPHGSIFECDQETAFGINGEEFIDLMAYAGEVQGERNGADRIATLVEGHVAGRQCARADGLAVSDEVARSGSRLRVRCRRVARSGARSRPLLAETSGRSASSALRALQKRGGGAAGAFSLGALTEGELRAADWLCPATLGGGAHAASRERTKGAACSAADRREKGVTLGILLERISQLRCASKRGSASSRPPGTLGEVTARSPFRAGSHVATGGCEMRPSRVRGGTC